MCDLHLDYTALSTRLGIDFRAYFATELPRFAEAESDGLVKLSANRLDVTDSGRLLVRNLAMHFDAYLDKSSARFSKTV
jgi:oxygen-independent coproporphyrinogen-3 oxidase